jgi:3-phytase
MTQSARFAPSLFLVTFVALQWHTVVRGELPTVAAVLETRPSFDDDAGGGADADDPAIWVHPKDGTRSLVVSTLKEGGLDVYDLSGRLVQHVGPDAAAPGLVLNSARYNNVDLIYGFKLHDEKVDLAVTTDRYNDMVRVFAIDPDAAGAGGAPLTEITAPGQPWIFADTPEELDGANTAYGLAVTQADPNGKQAFAFVSRSAFTSVAKLRLYASTDGRVGYEVVEAFDLPEAFSLPGGSTWHACHDDDGELSQVEGMVVDDYAGILYLGQEQVGWWATSVSAPAANLSLVDRVHEFGVPYARVWDEEEEEFSCEFDYAKSPGLGSPYLTADVEGLTIYKSGPGTGYLLVSSQGSDEFLVYDRQTLAHIGNFVVGDGIVDSVEESDGMHVVNVNLGGEFTQGLLVAHDGGNTPDVLDDEGEERDNSNFKFVRWADVAHAMGLDVDTTDRVRKRKQ